MKLKDTIISLIASNILLFATSVLALLVSSKLVKWFPWLYDFVDYLIATMDTIFVAILCYCIFRRVKLVILGIVYCVYLAFLSQTWCNVNGLSDTIAALRWLLGTLNAIVLLVGIKVISGIKSGTKRPENRQ